MNAELYGFTLLLRLQFMIQDFNPMTDYSLADIPASDDQISKAFKELPWCKRILANRQLVTRAEFHQRKSESNGGHKPDLMA